MPLYFGRLPGWEAYHPDRCPLAWHGPFHDMVTLFWISGQIACNTTDGELVPSKLNE